MIANASGQDHYRIALFGNRGYMSVILRELLDTKHHVVSVCANEPDGLKPRLRGTIGKFLRRIGLRKDNDFFLEDPFEGLDEPASLARKNGIPTLLPAKIRTREFADAISKAKPDIVLCAGFHRKIPPSVYGLAAKAAVNFHPSLLPAHRGGTPNRWVVFAGENRTGVTVHHLSADFDTGSIILSEEVPLDESDCWGDVEKKLLARLPHILNHFLDMCSSGPLAARVQAEDKASYELSFRGKYAQADWGDGPETFLRRCLALRPKTGVRTRYDGEPLCIWETGTGPEIGNGEPGEIVGFDGDKNPVVRCGGDTTLTILRVLNTGRLSSGAQMASRLKCKMGGRFD